MNIREKILVVEDEPNISRLICSVLKKQGYEVIQAWNGKEGLMLLSSACPDLVILDLGLPDMDGMELLRELREWSGMPVIVVSARTRFFCCAEAFNFN